MQTVFDGPMAANGFGEGLRRHGAGRNIVAHSAAFFTPAPYHAFGFSYRSELGETVLAGKAPVAGEPVDARRNGGAALLDAAMAFANVNVRRSILRSGIVEETFDFAHQVGLVGLDGEQVIGPRIQNGLRRAGVAGDGVDGNERPL